MHVLHKNASFRARFYGRGHRTGSKSRKNNRRQIRKRRLPRFYGVKIYRYYNIIIPFAVWLAVVRQRSCTCAACLTTSVRCPRTPFIVILLLLLLRAAVAFYYLQLSVISTVAARPDRIVCVSPPRATIPHHRRRRRASSSSSSLSSSSSYYYYRYLHSTYNIILLLLLYNNTHYIIILHFACPRAAFETNIYSCSCSIIRVCANVPRVCV